MHSNQIFSATLKCISVLIYYSMYDCTVIIIFSVLQIALPTAAIFSVLSDSEDTDSANEDLESSIYPTFVEKVQQFLQSLPQNYTNLFDQRNAFRTMFSMSTDERKAVEVETQTDVEKWKAERTGRITASNFGKILKFKNSPDSILLDILFSKDISTETIAWGKTMEKIAMNKFLEKISSLHVNLCIELIGLLIDKDEAYLAATPDGLVRCDCHEDHIIEIKCPFTHKSKMIAEIDKKNFFLDDNEILKENHNYYDQVQGQMALAGVSKCYFVTYTEKELHVHIIEFDELRWENSKSELKQFFYNLVFPEIASNRIADELKAAAMQCTCNTYKIVITVNCSKCNNTFHRMCTNLKSRKKSDWFCNSCKITV